MFQNFVFNFLDKIGEGSEFAFRYFKEALLPRYELKKT